VFVCVCVCVCVCVFVCVCECVCVCLLRLCDVGASGADKPLTMNEIFEAPQLDDLFECQEPWDGVIPSIPDTSFEQDIKSGAAPALISNVTMGSIVADALSEWRKGT
jgi:hypothetical protein